MSMIFHSKDVIMNFNNRFILFVHFSLFEKKQTNRIHLKTYAANSHVHNSCIGKKEKFSSLYMVIVSRAGPDLMTYWLACLAMEPEDRGRFPGGHHY